MALTVDTIETLLKARTGQYIKDMKAAEAAYDSWYRKVNGGTGDAGAAKAEATAQRRTRARSKEVESEVAATARISAMVEKSIAARDKEATAAERAADRIVRAGSKASAARQSALMSGTSLSAAPGQGPVGASDVARDGLIEQIRLRNQLNAATIAGDVTAITGLQDQIRYSQTLNSYIRQGLSLKDAQENAEQDLLRITQARTLAEARANAGAVAGVGRVANGYRNLGRQFQDIGVGLVGGQSFLLVLAQQLPQISDALTDVGTKAGFAGKAIKALQFFATPVGAIILALASAAAIFGAQALFASNASETLANRLQQAADGADAFGDAQGLLGRLVDSTTGKLRTQNDVLRASIRLQAILSKQQGDTEREKARGAITERASRQAGGGFGTFNASGTQYIAPDPVRFTDPRAQQLSSDLIAGRIGVDDALQKLQVIAKNAPKLAEDLSSLFVEFGQARAKGEASQALLNALDGKGVDPRLLPSRASGGGGRGSRSGGAGASSEDKFVNDIEGFNADMRQLRREQLDDELKITKDKERRAEILRELDEVEYAQRLAQINAQKNYTQQQKDGLKKELDAIFGPAVADGDTITINKPTPRQMARRAENEEMERQAQDRNNAITRESLAAQAELLTNRQERLVAEQYLLKLAQDEEVAALERSIAAGEIADAIQARADLAKKQGAQNNSLGRQYESPLEQYRREVAGVGNNINDSLESIEVNGLNSLNDGITEAITGAKSLGDAFKSVADQIISDLIRIAVQQAIIAPLASSLFGGGGNSLTSSPGDSSQILKTILGGAKSVSGGGFGGIISGLLGSIFGGGRAGGGTVGAGTFYKTSEYGTEGYASFKDPGRVIPLGEMNARQGGGNTTVVNAPQFNLRGAVVTPELYADMQRISQISAAQAATVAYTRAVKAAPGATATARRFGNG